MTHCPLCNFQMYHSDLDPLNSYCPKKCATIQVYKGTMSYTLKNNLYYASASCNVVKLFRLRNNTPFDLIIEKDLLCSIFQEQEVLNELKSTIDKYESLHHFI